MNEKEEYVRKRKSDHLVLRAKLKSFDWTRHLISLMQASDWLSRLHLVAKQPKHPLSLPSLTP